MKKKITLTIVFGLMLILSITVIVISSKWIYNTRETLKFIERFNEDANYQKMVQDYRTSIIGLIIILITSCLSCLLSVGILLAAWQKKVYHKLFESIDKISFSFQDYKEQRAKKQAERLEKKKQELKKKLKDLGDD